MNYQNLGAYLTFKLIFHKLGPKFILIGCEFKLYNCSWNQPVLSNEGKFSYPRKQPEPMMGKNQTKIN